MSQYRSGTFTSTGAAVNLNLGFLPDRVTVTNWTALATDASAVFQSDFYRNATPAGYASRLSKTVTTGAVTQAPVTSNGFTLVQLGGDWQSTQYTITGITKANPGVVTVSSVSPTNTLTLTNGMILTFSGVGGMTQVNQNRYVVAGLGVPSSDPTKFYLYDLFGNPVDTSSFGTYTSGGIANQISYPATAPTINATTGQISAQGNPAGNQYDIGYQGITLGTGVVGSSTNVIFWEAWTMTPTGY